MGKPSQINLSLSFQLDEGQLAFWLISPAGDLILQTDAAQSLEEQFTIDAETGLWSMIVVSHFNEDGQMKGQFSVQGAIAS